MMEAKKSPDGRSGREDKAEYIFNNNGSSEENQTALPQNIGLPPRCIESEQVTLGAIFQDRQFWERCKDRFEPGAFHLNDNKELARTFVEMERRGIQIDLVTLLDFCRAQGDKAGEERAGGSSYWTYLTEIAGTVGVDTDYHFDRVNEHYLKRREWEKHHKSIQALEQNDFEKAERLNEEIRELSLAYNGTGSRLKIVSAAKLPDVEPPESLWAGLLYPGCTTYFPGDPGSGKTTFAYNVGGQGAQGGSFLDIPFSKPIKTLYVDMETPEWLRRQKIEAICGELPEGFHLLSEINLARDLGELISECRDRKYDLIVFDTQSRVLSMEDENDNSEANRAAAMLSRLTRETGAAVLLVHHNKKGDSGKGVYRGRGASAFAAAVDVVVNLEVLDADTLRLKVEKSRVPGVFQTIRMKRLGGDRFERIAVEEVDGGSELRRTQELILNLLSQGGEWRTAEILERGKAEGFSERTIKRALDRLRQAGKLHKVRQGFYVLSGAELLGEVPEMIR